MRRLILGPAGCGKTHLLLDEFEKALRAGDPLQADTFFVLPSAEHTDRMISLILQRGIPGFFHGRVTTFSSLVSEIFSQGPERYASNVTRYLILKGIFAGKRWDYFEAVQNTPGFLSLALSFVAELKEAMIGPEMFRERMNRLKIVEPELAVKYEALAGIYESYQAALGRQGLWDRQDVFRKRYLSNGVSDGVRPHDPMKYKFRWIWLDGFFDFSNLQLEYLKVLSSLSSEITVTLTYEPNSKRPELFRGIDHTFRQLQAMGFQPELLKPVNYRTVNPELQYLERNIFNENLLSSSTNVILRPKAEESEVLRSARDDKMGSLQIFEAVGIQGEVEMMAREILQTYRRGGYRFSDFAVLLRQIGGYGAILRSVFDRFEIPVEIHERERLTLSPMAETLRSLLFIFLEDWKREHVLHFLKSSCVRRIGGELFKDYDWASALENYAFKEGVLKGRQNWIKAWSSQGEIPEGWNDEKAERLRPLCDLQDNLLKAKTPGQMIAQLGRAIEETFQIFIPEDSYQEPVRRDAASRARIQALFEEITAQWAAQNRVEVTFRDFAEHLLRLLEVDLYSLRERNANRVQVYDVSLARQKEYRVVFVAGLLEKTFPMHHREDPVLSDWERELFNHKAPLPLRLQQPRQQLERYLFYLAVTRARERLILTFPRLDLEGKESLPSFYVSEIDALFESSVPRKKQDLSHPYPAPEDAISARELEISVMGDLWHWHPRLGKEDLLPLIARVLERPGVRERFQEAQQEIQAEIRDGKIIEKDYFKSLRTSPTTLEDYAKCPYKYFARRVLKLQDPQEEINVFIKGKIRHKVAENFIPQFLRKPGMSSLEMRSLVNAELEKALGAFPLMIEKKYQRDLYAEEIRRALFRFLEEEMEFLRRTQLQPAYFELSFGKGKQGLAPLVMKDSDERTFKIVGQMDRVDVDPDKGTALVVDYKTSDYWNKKQLESGASLQLPIYLMVIARLLKVKPVGAQLRFFNGDRPKGFFDEKTASIYPGLSKRSMLPADEFQALMDRSEAHIKRFMREISEANIAVMPRDENSCEKCPYPAVCRIRKWQVPLMVETAKGIGQRAEG